MLSDSTVIAGALALVGVVITAVVGARSRAADDTTKRLELLITEQGDAIDSLKEDVQNLRDEVDRLSAVAQRWRALLDIALANIRSWVAWDAGGRHGDPPGIRRELREHILPGPYPREPPDTS